MVAPMPRPSELPALLLELDEAGLLRTPDDGLERVRLAERFGTAFLDLSSNDYLGLAADHVSRETLLSTKGAGASRLIYGTRPEHLALEAELADWVGHEAALLFSSGYAANVGALAALLAPSDHVFSDALNHASLIDGCRLSRAQVHVFPHRDLDALARALDAAPSSGARWVVVESYFSMDGDGPDLPRLRALCDAHGAALYVDEAHSLGVFGPSGAGLCAAAGVRPDVLLGALGKAVGSHGAFIAGSAVLRTWLWNRARSFVFSTAPSPLAADASLEQVRRARAAEAERSRVLELSLHLRAELGRRGVPCLSESFGPILGLVVGDAERALATAARLREAGILVQAIRPPTVPRGTARLRITISARHSAPQLTRAAELLAAALQEPS
jgi:8-amino-7-oxononanoate synthase